MRTLLHVVALVGGAAIVYGGISQGVPASPASAHEWGSVAGVGFGAMLMLVGLRYLWLRSKGDDSELGSGAALLVMLASVGVTVGVMAWRGGSRTASAECAAMLDHVQGLFADDEGAQAARARFEAARPELLEQCRQTPSERRRCPLQATSLEEVARCP